MYSTTYIRHECEHMYTYMHNVAYANLIRTNIHINPHTIIMAQAHTHMHAQI